MFPAAVKSATAGTFTPPEASVDLHLGGKPASLGVGAVRTIAEVLHRGR
jgi:hypothetical protein